MRTPVVQKAGNCGWAKSCQYLLMTLKGHAGLTTVCAKLSIKARSPQGNFLI